MNNDLQNTTQKTKDRATRTPLRKGSCSTRGASHVTLVTNVMISHEGRNDLGVLITSRPYLWSFVTQIINNVKPSHGGYGKTFEVLTST